MPGSEVVLQALARHGVRTIFSLSGNQIMPLYDACIDAGIRIVHVRHEAAAVFMADAWAQVTGEIGVALLTAGPGIANGVAPLFSAMQSETPVLLLSGDSPVAEDGKGSFQELDQVTLTRPLTKLSRRVMGVGELAAAVDEAIAVAMAPRRGPVHLALPFDVLTAPSDAAPRTTSAHAVASTSVSSEHLAVMSDLFATAQRPILLAGPASCRSAVQQAWSEIGERLQVPVLRMESPRGLRDPSLGAAASQIARADLVILAGKRLDFTVGFGRGAVFAADAKVVALDPDRAMLERAQGQLGARLAIACEADALPVLQQLPAARAGQRSGWLRDVAAAVASREESKPATVAAGAVASRQLCEHVQRFLDAFDGETILVCDGGEFGQWAQAFCRAPVRVINGPGGAIGGGLCYATAAKIARPQATVVLLMGDGTSGFHFMEFDTAVRENAPFIAVIGNDLRWNAEHQIQLREYGAQRLIGCSLAGTARYHDAAQALGGFGASVTAADTIDAALRAAAASGLPSCVNVRIDGQPAPVFAAAVPGVH
jgi:acetolactate synthase-1/2/3 large subunit